MKINTQSILLLLTVLLSIGCQQQDGTLLIKNITTIDAVNGKKEQQYVLIKDNRILAIQDTEDGMSAPRSIDGSGKFLIPGLWDAHVHLTFEEEVEEHMFDLFIANGITSIRDTGGQIEELVRLKKEASEMPTHRPRVKIAGPLIDGSPRVYDGHRPGVPDISKGVATPEEAREVVTKLADAGVDLIKAYEMLTPELFEAVVDEAAKHNLKVTGHIPLQMTVQQASDMGMASVEHMRNLEMSMVEGAEDKVAERVAIVNASKDSLGYPLRSRMHNMYRFSSLDGITRNGNQTVLNTLNKNQTWQIPTLALVLSFELLPWSDPEWKETFNYLPEKTRTQWLEDTEGMMEVPTSQNQQNYMDWASSMIPAFLENDIPVMAGTDCPIFFLTPGFSLHRELEVLVEQAGISEMAALKTATYNPALYFNMEDELGTIDQGKIADLVVLSKDPLEDINHTTTIEVVIKDGFVHDKVMLEELLSL